MYRIKTKLIILFIIQTLTNTICVSQGLNNQSKENFKILKGVSKLYSSGLNREILLSKKIADKIYDFTTYYSFCNSIYKDLRHVDIKGIISESDIIELQKKVVFSNSPKKWNRKQLKEFEISTTKNKIGNKKSKSLYQTSMPIFFNNDRYAIIYVQEYCGLESGSRSLEIFRKNDSNVWNYFGEILIGIS